MKGDFSRIRFNPGKLYSAVLKQQGRVDLDSDANEQSFIDGYLRDTTNVDVIGEYGGPIGCAGFELTINGNSISISPGRYYVNGILVENPCCVDYDSQPYLDNPDYTAQQLLAAVEQGGGTIAQFTLEVWQRMVTGLDDNCLLEPALGQADTTTRLQTVWRVIGSLTDTSAIPAAEPVNPVNPVTELAPCCQMLYNSQSALSRTGAMSADTNQTGNDCNCLPIASAGYQGLENQLYRVEIHTSGNLNTATFKWSRENASVVTQVTNVSSAVVTVSSLGPDANLGYQAGQWVELTDDTYLFSQPANRSGQLYQILSVNQAALQVTMTNPVYGVNTNMNARMRRWDQSGAAAQVGQGIPLSATATQLEYGIEVTFRSGNYQTGDYWTIPARTADGQIAWPPCGGNGNLFQPASYMQLYEAPLACIQQRPANAYVPQAGQSTFENYVLSDCRLLFSPLTALNSTVAKAIHVASTSWANDDVMTVDTLVQSGLSVTFDQAPSCPWGGGNFQVTMELPVLPDGLIEYQGQDGLQAAGNYPPGTNIFGRSVSAVDPPLGMAVSGTQVSFMTAMVNTGGGWSEAYYLYIVFNTALSAATPLGFARMRVRLHGDAIYANGPAGNLYLDGIAYGETGSRVVDGSPCVSLVLPSGNQLKASDFESWFYLAPSLVISGMSLELLNSDNAVVGTNAVTLIAGRFGGVSGWETTQVGNSPSVPVQSINVIITFSYPPVAATTVTFQLTYSGEASILTIANPYNVAAGQSSITVPVNIVGNPGLSASGAPNVDTVTIGASVAGLFSPIPFGGTVPTLVVTGTSTFKIVVQQGGFSTIDTSGIDFAKNFEAVVEAPKPAEATPKPAAEAPKEAEGQPPQNPAPPKE